MDFDKDTNTKSTMSIWKSQEEEKLNQEFYNFEVSQPLIRKNQSLLELDKKENSEIKYYGKKLISTFLTFLGAFMTYSCSLTIFQIFIANLAEVSNPIIFLFIFVIGILFMILGNEKFQQKRNYLIYLSIPLMSLILGFLFTLAPAHWHGRLFGAYSLLFFPIILILFYHLKDKFTFENK